MFLYAFNDRELMEMCTIVSERILTYFQDVLLKDYPLEQYQVAEYRKYLRRYFRSIITQPPDVPSNGSVISIKKVIIGIEQPNVAFSEIKMTLDFPWFQHVGPSALIRILMAVTYNTLISLRHTMPPSPHNFSIIEKCLEKRRLVKSLLKRIVSQMPNNRIYPVNDETMTTTISIQIEILDENRHL
jgi:hypothetical protein